MAKGKSRFMAWLLRLLRIFKLSQPLKLDDVPGKYVDSWSSSESEPDLESGLGRAALKDEEGLGLKLNGGITQSRKLCFKKLDFQAEVSQFDILTELTLTFKASAATYFKGKGSTRALPSFQSTRPWSF
jgi:hypothetical protein